jgi:hypothetical protein
MLSGRNHVIGFHVNARGGHHSILDVRRTGCDLSTETLQVGIVTSQNLNVAAVDAVDFILLSEIILADKARSAVAVIRGKTLAPLELIIRLSGVLYVRHIIPF